MFALLLSMLSVKLLKKKKQKKDYKSKIDGSEDK